MLILEKGMRIQLLQDVVYYDPQTFEPHTILKGTFGEIEYTGVGLPRDTCSPPVPIISTKFNDMTRVYTGEMFQEFRKMYKVV
jgi:hypothetical protein